MARIWLFERLNGTLDRLARFHLLVRGRELPSFYACGLAGFALGLLLVLGMAGHQSLSASVMAAVALLAAGTFLGLALLTAVLTGEERLVYYHSEIAVLVVVGIGLRIARQPVLPYLDLMVLGTGLFLACGRLGCLMAGCCHGQPHSWGICYREEHAKDGFPRHLLGVRLFPLQAVEALWVLSAVLVEVGIMLSGRPAGTALSWYACAYAVGRFGLEFLRGDADRPYFAGLSEAQWTSLLLAIGMVMAGKLGWVPQYPWQVGAAALLGIATLGVIVSYRVRGAKPGLLHPRHIQEVAMLVHQTSRAGGNEPAESTRSGQLFYQTAIGSTSLGIHISTGWINRRGGWVEHYAFSEASGGMTESTARSLAQLIVHLRGHPVGRIQVANRESGVFHLLLERCSSEVEEQTSNVQNTNFHP